MGSLNPKHINAHLKHAAIAKGMVIWGAILEKGDYVYTVELGVKNSRAILPFKNCADKVFVEGQPAWFIIIESKIQDSVCTLTVSANEDDICHSIMKHGHIDHIAPAMCVQFTVSKVLKDGLQGTFFEEYLGYINQIYLNTPMDSLEKYKDTTIKAYILYIHPITKFTFLTTRNLHLPQEPTALPKGYIGSAKILSNLGKGVAVHLKKNELGFVTYKRLLRSLKLNDSSDITELVKRKFPVGSTHNCRIMDYINIDKMYICTFEQSELKEEIFNVNDLKIGQLVKGSIEGINSSGITVKIGKLTGFVTNEHISNVQYSDNLKRNYHIGDLVTARVWFINGDNIKLTLKQGFVKEDKCLTSYKMAKKNDEYKGMVVNTYSSGVLVVFYGGVKGWLRFVDTSKDYQNMFYQGQIINVTITEKHTNKLFLSLDKSEDLNHRKLQIGQYTSGTVESIKTDGIVIRTAVGSFQGLLPTNHILINCKLSNIMKNLYGEGDIIENLMCIAKDKGRILSLRECTYYKDDKFYVPRRNQLKQGLVLRCSIKSFQKKQLLLTSPILFFNGFIEVNSENIMEGSESLEDVNFAEGQAVIAKLTEVNDSVLKATVKLSDVFDYDFQYPVDLLRRYLTEVDKIQQKLMLRGDNIAQYKIGQRINCEIMKINNFGCSVRLSDGVQGIVVPEHWPNKPLIGSFHEGVVLYVNFIDKYLEISLNDTTNQKICKDQGNFPTIFYFN
ncbi:hypothetical protein AMK59_7651 [Oryctes borbonicus]|uniref:S1 motif domain-containing protein n=1 Tax=Oryctes borbonicus TaxID=1629725 RepID=A0A0T6B0J1_9SCAR|nr:hypothetical protein AMK59_7651 [Oryctes borbonicus]